MDLDNQSTIQNRGILVCLYIGKTTIFLCNSLLNIFKLLLFCLLFIISSLEEISIKYYTNLDNNIKNDKENIKIFIELNNININVNNFMENNYNKLKEYYKLVLGYNNNIIIKTEHEESDHEESNHEESDHKESDHEESDHEESKNGESEDDEIIDITNEMKRQKEEENEKNKIDLTIDTNFVEETNTESD
tara:strand:- start:2636 stop:3208 length:573 start_codon:yes stop_codon:yes gene_type:complete